MLAPAQVFRSPYPSSAYLLRAEKRYRYRDAAGRVDLDAVSRVVKLLPHDRDLAPEHRSRLAGVLDRLTKATIAYGDLAESGLLDERFGIPVLLEVPFGGIRRGVGADGQPWENPLVGAAYGFLPDTVARDAEEIDVIVGPDTGAVEVFALRQLRGDGSGELDEYKLGLGFPSADAFEQCYLANWPGDRFGGIAAMPLEVLQGLLGFELSGEEGAVAKALAAVAGEGGLFAVTKCGGLFGRVTWIDRGHPPTVKGLALPGRLRPCRADLLEKIAPPLLAAAERCRKAFATANEWRGEAIPLADRPDLAGHPALTEPLSWMYDDPRDVGGWLGAIEPMDETWIAFVDIAGRVLLWMQRESDGAVVGAPVEFRRPDLARPDLMPAAKNANYGILPAASVGWYAGPDTAATEPTDHRCPICGLPWTADDVRTYSLMAIEGPSVGVSLFYRTHRTCAVAASEAVIGDLDRQALEHAAQGRLLGQKAPLALTEKAIRKTIAGGIAPRILKASPEDHTIELRTSGDALLSVVDVLKFFQYLGQVGASRGLYHDDADDPANHYFGQVTGFDGDGPSKIDRIVVDGREVRHGDNPSDPVLKHEKEATRRGPPIKASVRLLPVSKEMTAATPPKRRIVYGVVLEPEPFDGRGDGHDETYDEGTIEQAAHDYLASFANIDDRHGRFFRRDEVAPVESYIVRKGFVHCGTPIKEGSWVLAARILSDEVWGRVLRGELAAWSIEGYAERVPNA